MNMRKIIAVLAAVLMLCAAVPMGALSVVAAPGDVIIDADFNDGMDGFNNHSVIDGALVIDGSLTVAAGTLEITDTLTNNGTLTVTGDISASGWTREWVRVWQSSVTSGMVEASQLASSVSPAHASMARINFSPSGSFVWLKSISTGSSLIPVRSSSTMLPSASI